MILCLLIASLLLGSYGLVNILQIQRSRIKDYIVDNDDSLGFLFINKDVNLYIKGKEIYSNHMDSMVYLDSLNQNLTLNIEDWDHLCSLPIDKDLNLWFRNLQKEALFGFSLADIDLVNYLEYRSSKGPINTYSYVYSSTGLLDSQLEWPAYVEELSIRYTLDLVTHDISMDAEVLYGDYSLNLHYDFLLEDYDRELLDKLFAKIVIH